MICKKVCVYPLENKPLQFLKKTPNGHAKNNNKIRFKESVLRGWYQD